jgi:hypothetical protein
MSEQNKPSSAESIFPVPLKQEDEDSLREYLRLANAEIEASLKRIQSSREESDRLAAQIEEVMSKLRAAWLC